MATKLHTKVGTYRYKSEKHSTSCGSQLLRNVVPDPCLPAQQQSNLLLVTKNWKCLSWVQEFIWNLSRAGHTHFLDSQKNLAWKRRSLVQPTADSRTNYQASWPCLVKLWRCAGTEILQSFMALVPVLTHTLGKKPTWKFPCYNLCLLSFALSPFTFLKGLALCTLLPSFR